MHPRAAELIREREDQRPQRGLVVRVHREDIAVDRLGLCRLVEEAVALRAFERVGNAVRGNLLEREVTHPILLGDYFFSSASSARVLAVA